MRPLSYWKACTRARGPQVEGHRFLLHWERGGRFHDCLAGWAFSARGPALSVPRPLCVSGLRTRSALLRPSLVIWKQLQGNAAFTFLSFLPPLRYWENATPAVLLLSGEGGLILFVCL